MPKRSAAVLLAVALVACGGGAKKTTKNVPPPPPRSALTGLVAADATVLKRCVLAVKVENSTAARPQSGLQRADLVYEEIAEGGITRFIALYQSHDAAQIGPVRSARLVDPNVLAPYHAALVYSGAHPVVQAAVKRSGMALLEYGDYPSAFWRSKARVAPHNLYTSTPGLRKFAKCPAPSSGLFSFEEQPPALPSPAPSGAASASPSPSAVGRSRGVRIEFSSSQTSIWRYDAQRDLYVRWQGSQAHLLDDGSQVAARNVVLMYVQVKQAGYLDPAGNPAYDVIVVGSGRLVLYRNGLKVTGRWSHAGAADRTAMTDSTGRAMALAPGVTWIELVPVASAASDL